MIICICRPASAPAIPPEGQQLEQEEPSHKPSVKAMLKSYTLDGPIAQDVVTGAHPSMEQRETSVHRPRKSKARVSTH